jgi:hypothetical protein
LQERPTTKTRFVFVSHSGPDTWVAKQIAREIQARGVTTFLDEAQIPAGADFEEEILKFMEKAHELVVLLTPWALERSHVWAEIGAAWVRRIPIVALLLGFTTAELETRPSLAILKRRNLLQLNEIGKYLDELAARVQHSEG